MFDDGDAEEAGHAENAEPDFGGLRTVRQLKKHVTETVRATLIT